MFIGEYNHTVDAKGRVSMPARFRDDLGDAFYITRGMENCLFVYDQREWALMDEKVRNLKLTAKSARGFSRLFYAGAMEIAFDKQGRILIPPHLREFASIEKDVVIVGVSNRIEIWSKDKWNAYLGDDSMNYDDLADALDGFDL